jgi:ABC-type polysaccharide/polyol phosphate transport system ATPase subunit
MSKASQVIRVDVKHLEKEFKVPHERHSSLKASVINFHKRSFETFKVLNDITFQVKEGEFFGILGRNGSGKSTLLKLLADIYTPSGGSLHVNGQLTPFIELGVGFNPELTGRENVFLNGAILGLTQKEIEEKYDEIVRFAEIERFMDQKLKNYSSGMQVRLAFSIAIQAHNAILLIDEVLAVGDERFQQKCLEVFAKIKQDPSKTVIFVSHDMSSVQKFCDRAIVIHDGKLIYEGNAEGAVYEYKKLNFPEQNETPDAIQKDRWGNSAITIDKFEAKEVHVKDGSRDIIMTLKTSVHDEKLSDKEIACGIGIWSAEGVNIAGPNSLDYSIAAKNSTVTYTINNHPLNTGSYKVTAVLYDKITGETYDHHERRFKLPVIGKKTKEIGTVILGGVWQQGENKS